VDTGVDTGDRSETFLVDLGSGETTPIDGLTLDQDLDVSPDGASVASGGRQIMVADINGGDVRKYEATRPADAEGVNAPRWSPDGSTIVYQVDGRSQKIGNLFALDAASGRVTQLTDLEQISAGLWYMSPSYSPDGRSILFTSPTGNGDRQTWHLWSIPAAGGEPTLVLRDAGFGEYSPDGSTIAYTRVSGDGEFGGLFIANADGSNRRKLDEGTFYFPRWSPDGTRIAYADDWGGVWVVDVATGETTRVADRTGWPEWVDDDTLMIPE
jgi:Tol biopolymer transport system component